MLRKRIPLLLRQWMCRLSGPSAGDRGGALGGRRDPIFARRPVSARQCVGASGNFPFARRSTSGAGDSASDRVIYYDGGLDRLSILLMTLTFASMQFSPRIILSFATDRP